ncbi:MAG TPA: hypothetical protein VGC22_03320 [Chitinophaga sp.]
MKMWMIVGVSITLLLGASCKKGANGVPDTGGGDSLANNTPTWELQDKKEIFGFDGQQRYSYCPGIVKEDNGTTHLFFCGTQNRIMVDNIYHISIGPDGTQTPPKVVLQPGPPGAWDDHHTCDPSVIKGNFRMNGTAYQYALFYLTNMYGVDYNEIGVAFSNDLNADSWVKYPYQLVKKTWAAAGNQVIGAANAWGVGQPSAVSLDEKGKVLLTYTIGDIDGTRVVFTQVDMSDMDAYVAGVPATMTNNGLSNLQYNGNDVTTDADVAVDVADSMIVIARPVHPNPDNTYPAYIETAVEVAYLPLNDFLHATGAWKQMLRISPGISGYPRNHNPGIERDAYGRIKDWENPVVYYTVSLAAPDVAPAGTRFAEWTYHIWRGAVVKK